MESDVKEVLELEENAPYLIDETELGKFYIVKSIGLLENEAFIFNYSDNDPLSLGRDILEVPNRKLEIIVEHEKGYLIGPVVYNLRKYAHLSNYDYVSYEPYMGQFINNVLCTKDNIKISKVMPRLFRKILDN